jgi:hypothetical protein
MTLGLVRDAGKVPGVERRKCACGGVIFAMPYEKSIRVAVETHQLEPRHKLWRAGLR